MDWLYSFFVTPKAVEPEITVTVPETIPTEESIPASVTVVETGLDEMPGLDPVTDPDPEEFSPNPDSKFQYKTRSAGDFKQRASKKARNKAIREGRSRVPH